MQDIKVLMVDDLPENLHALDALIKDETVLAFKANSGREALEMLLQHQFALAFIDVRMPEIDGFELAELMRGSDRTKSIPIIFVTAEAHNYHLTFKGHEFGAVDILYKPLNPLIVKSKLKVFIELYSQKRQLEIQVEQLQRSEARQRFLAEASAIFSSSLDYLTTLKGIAKLAISYNADCCLIDVLQKDHTLKRLVVEHRDPRKRELALGLEQYPPRALSSSKVWKVIMSGIPDILTNLTPAYIKSTIQNDEHFRLIQELNPLSHLILPLKGTDKILGAISFISTQPTRLYSEADVGESMDMAQRAAVALENALLYKEVQEAVLARDEFLSIASHELKTPVTSLKLQLQMVERGIAKGHIQSIQDNKLKKLLMNSEKQITRLTGLIEDLLDVSRIQNGKLYLHTERMDLVELAQEVMERLAGEFAKNRCEVRLMADGEVLGPWDRHRIDQVLVNLLTNALKYGNRCPVEIRIFKKDDKAYLQVKDQGIGISRENQTKVFERFERLGGRTGIGGLGLGLYIVKQIVQAHQGKIHLESEVDKGTTFFVELPL